MKTIKKETFVPNKINVVELKKQLRKNTEADHQINGLVVKGLEQYFGLSTNSSSYELPGGIKTVNPQFAQFLVDLNIMELS